MPGHSDALAAELPTVPPEPTATNAHQTEFVQVRVAIRPVTTGWTDASASESLVNDQGRSKCW